MDVEEPRYTSTELAELYYAFMRDKTAKRRMEKDKLDYWEQTELVIRFLGYVRNYAGKKQTMEDVKKEERRKTRLFGEPTRGDLFTIGS
jgi:hypothetical protein